MKVTLLGTGTSTGVPIPGCALWCLPLSRSKNKRLRCSIYLEVPSGIASEETNSIDAHLVADIQSTGDFAKVEDSICILVDTGPDLRQQALANHFSKLDAVFYTHTHADHTFGIDDLRGFNFINQKPIPVHATPSSAAILEQQFRYCFFPDPEYEGGAPPQLILKRIEPYQPIRFGACELLPLPVYHGSMEVMAYRIGNFGYVTDCSAIPDRTADLLQDLDVLVLDGLRERPHKTHFTIAQAAEQAAKLRAKQTYLTHISHELEHHATNEKLRGLAKTPVELAYDGLVLNFGSE